MKPHRIILIRHAESEGNIDKSIYNKKPDYTLELSENGKEQADKAGADLRSILKDQTVFFYVSPMWRTRITFERIAKYFDKEKISYREEPRIREQEWSSLDMSASRIKEDISQYGSFYYRIPGGESGCAVYDRVSDFLGTLHRDFEKENFPQNTIMVTHGMTFRLFLMRWFHLTVEQFDEIEIPKNCEMAILEKQSNGKYKLITELKKHVLKHKYQRPITL